MAEREKHLFEFPADKIAITALEEAEYHRLRLIHWREREAAAAEKVRATISVKLTQHPVTGGSRWDTAINYGDQEAWQELRLCEVKVDAHRRAVERYETAARVYGTQGQRPYMLDPDDVEHYRLGGQERED